MASMATKKRPQLERQIVAAIEASEMTMYDIADRAKINRSMLSRFVNGRGGMTVATLAKVAPILQMEIVTKETKR